MNQSDSDTTQNDHPAEIIQEDDLNSPSSTKHGHYVPPLPGTGLDKCNVFVKFLPTEVTDTGLYTMFSKFGEITSYKVMVDPYTGSSLGYGFCRFKSPEDASRAIAEMSGTVIGNKTLLCKLSHGISKNNASPNDNLYIKPLLPTTTEQELFDLYSQFGDVIGCKVMMDRNTGLSRQIGFVRFSSIESATKALEQTNGMVLKEGTPPIVVKYAENEPHKINRKAKLLANQSAAAARKAIEQYKLHQQSMQYSDVSYPDPSTYGQTEEYSNASIPYVVKDSFGNVTFAPTSVPDMYMPGPVPTYDWYSYDMYQQSYPMYNQYGYMMNNWYRPKKNFKRKGKYKYNRNEIGENRVSNWVEPNLFVFHLPPSVDNDKLRQLFEKFGKLEQVQVVKDKSSKKTKGYGFVKFSDMNDAITAITKMNGYRIENKTLKVTLKSDSHSRRSKLDEDDEDSKSSDDDSKSYDSKSSYDDDSKSYDSESDDSSDGDYETNEDQAQDQELTSYQGKDKALVDKMNGLSI